jgi:hypothetical protein
MRPDSTQNIVAKKAQLHQRPPKLKLLFYDATTHPLGDSALNVNV